MGIILTTINTFFGIINTIFSLINIIFIGGLILAVVYIGPKIKAIFDGFTTIQSLNSKLMQNPESSKQPCLTQKEIDDIKKKLNNAKDNIDQFKKFPLVGGLLPESIISSISDSITSVDDAPICQ